MKQERKGRVLRGGLRTRMNEMLQKMIPKNRKQLFLWYTILFFVVLIGSYLPFFVLDRTLLWEYDDGFLQHYEWLCYLKKVICQFFSGNGFSFWSWSFGLGADTVGFLGGVLCDPFNYVAVLFPESHIDIGYTFAIFFRLYVAGIGFLWFGKVTKMRLYTSLLGALSYSFSSWLFLCSTRHDTFVTAAVMFVFLMVGVEKILRHQSPLPFIVATFFSAVTSIYFLYMSAILIFVYFLIHFIKNEKKSFVVFLKLVGRFLLYAGIAVLLAAVVIIPVVTTLSNAVTEGAVEYNLFYGFEVYSNYITSLVSGNEIFFHFSTFYVSALFLILIPVIFVNIIHRKASAAMVTYLCCLVFLILPVINAFFNGMGYPVGRWCYGATFFFIWSGLQCLETSINDIEKMKKVIYGFLAFLGSWLVLVCRVVLRLSNEKILILGVINIAAGFVIAHIICDMSNHKNRARKQIFLVLVMSLNVVLFHAVEYFPGVTPIVSNYSKKGAIHNKLNYSTQKAGLEIEDDSFYRIDQSDFIQGGEAPEGYVNRPSRYVHVPANETLIFNTRSLYVYNSLVPASFFDFNHKLCNNASYFRRVCVYNNDNRARLDFLTGVKYFLGNNSKNYPPNGSDEFAGYGFELFKKSSGGVNILKTNYSLGLGCIFDHYITQEEWMSLDYADREQALMECIVLPDDSQGKGLLHKDVKDISSGQRNVPFHFKDPTYVQGGDGSAFSEESMKNSRSFHVSQANGGFTISLDQEVNDSEIYFMFRGLKRQSGKKDMNNNLNSRLELLRSKVKSTDTDYGDFGIYASNGVITKAAYNTIGSVSGFSDINDFMINMGVVNKGSTEIKVTFDHAGTYTFDALEVVAVPLASFQESAGVCMKNSFTTDVISDNYVSGKVSTDKPESMLYLSIPYYKGWSAYVDGVETKLQQIDTAYSGVHVTGEGEHKIELRYRPVGFRIGLISFVMGLIAVVLVSCFHYRNRKQSTTHV